VTPSSRQDVGSTPRSRGTQPNDVPLDCSTTSTGCCNTLASLPRTRCRTSGGGADASFLDVQGDLTASSAHAIVLCSTPRMRALSTCRAAQQRLWCAWAQAPSNAPAATEFELLEQYTTIVPDTVTIEGWTPLRVMWMWMSCMHLEQPLHDLRLHHMCRCCSQSRSSRCPTRLPPHQRA
jgi:hypothetical protein